MNPQVYSSSALSDLGSLIELFKLLSDKKEAASIIGEIKLKMEALKEKEKELALKEVSLSELKASLEKLMGEAESEKAKSAKMLVAAEKNFADSEAKTEAFAKSANDLSKAKEEFEAFKMAEKQTLEAQAAKIAQDLGKSKEFFDSAKAMEFEYKEKLAKLKDVVG